MAGGQKGTDDDPHGFLALAFIPALFARMVRLAGGAMALDYVAGIADGSGG